MPKQPINYDKTIMYRIICKNPEIKDCYVGSTTDFKSRKQRHKHNCNSENSKHYNINVYQFIREHNGWDNWEMLEIEKYNAIDKSDQAKRERYWLELYNATLNSYIPSRTKKEYEEYNKEYYEQNKEQIKEYYKEYYKKYKEENNEQINMKITCCCGSIYTKRCLKQHELTKKHINFIEQNK